MASNIKPISDTGLAQALSSVAAAMTIAAPRRPAGMSALRFTIFEAIDRLDCGAGVTYHALQRETKLSSATLSEHLRSLRYKGLVQWARIALSDSGRALLADRGPRPPHQISDIFPIAASASPRGNGEPAVAPTPPPQSAAAGTQIQHAADERALPAEGEKPSAGNSRLEMIRAAARRLSERKNPKPCLPLSGVAAQTTKAPVTQKPDWITERRVRLQGAITFLKSKCIIVQVANPDAAVRQYLMSGNFNRFTAEQVIARATRLGWEGEAQ